MYQMLPTESWAYQLSVTSSFSPVFASVMVSLTSTASTPLAICLVSSVTSMTTRSLPPSVSVSL